MRASRRIIVYTLASLLSAIGCSSEADPDVAGYTGGVGVSGGDAGPSTTGPTAGASPGWATGGSAAGATGGSGGPATAAAGGTPAQGSGGWVADPTGGGTSVGGSDGATTGATGGAFSTGGGSVSTGGTESAGASGSGSFNPDGPEPIGSGWVEYHPDFDYHVPPNASAYGERYTYEDGVFHLWVKDTDLSSFPGQDSGPRSEVRVRNEYTSGSRQFQADMKVVAGAERVGIWQLFFRPYPWMIRVYDGALKQYGDGSTFQAAHFDEYRRFHAIHHTATRRLELYLDGELVLATTLTEGDGSSAFYNKFGVYGREGMGALNEIYYRNVHYFRKD